jgi:hypothetical protein
MESPNSDPVPASPLKVVPEAGATEPTVVITPTIGRVHVEGSHIQVESLILENKEIAAFLLPLDDAQRAERTSTALEIGFLCLQRAVAHSDLDFVRRNVQELLAQVTGAVGSIPVNLERGLSERLGAENGPVLTPLLAAVTNVSDGVHRKLLEVQSLLSEDIDPRKESSAVGQALRTIRELLDPKSPNSIQGAMQQALRDLEKPDGPLARIQILLNPKHEDSIQHSVKTSIETVTSKDGELVKTVKNVVEASLKPVGERLDHLALAVKGEEAREEALMEGPAGGRAYEDVVIERLSEWTSFAGGRVDHVGVDNQPGDAIVTVVSQLPGQPPIKVVIEAKALTGGAKGNVAISRELKTVLEKRKGTQAAVYVAETSDCFTKEVHDWAEGEIGDAPYVATVHENLIVAVRYVTAMKRLKLLADEKGQGPVDISAQLASIRTALNHLTNITKSCGSLRSSADKIQDEAGELRIKVSEAISEIDRRLASASAEP